MDHIFNTWLEKRMQGEKVELHMPTAQQDMGGLYLTDGINLHINWRNNWLESLRQGQQLDSEKVSADNLCKFGQWLYNDGLIHQDRPEYEGVRIAHANFHKTAGEVVKLHQQKRFTDAMVLSKNQLMELSRETSEAMYRLNRAIHA